MKRGYSAGEIQEERKMERFVRMMFEAELYSMKCGENRQKPVVFSESFERRMEKLIDWERRKYQIRTGVRYVLSAAAVLLIILCLTNPGYIVKAWDVLVKWHKTHLEVDMPDTEWMGAVPEYELTYVPEGFEVVEENYDEFGGMVRCEKGEKYFRLNYFLPNGNYQYDNEHSEISVIQDKEGNDVLLVKFEDESYSMLWVSKDNIMFSIYADVNEEELFKIKDGIKLK